MNCAECVQHMKFAKPGAATAPLSLVPELLRKDRRLYKVVTSSQLREFLLASGHREPDIRGLDKRDLWDLVQGGDGG